MKRNFFIIIAVSFVFHEVNAAAYLTLAHAIAPPTKIVDGTQSVEDVTVTNNSGASLIPVFKSSALPAGVTLMMTASSSFPSPCDFPNTSLQSGQSCTIRLQYVATRLMLLNLHITTSLN